MAKEKSSRIDLRTRNWTFLVYPESSPEDWRNIINAERIPWVESPLHEGELNPDSEGEKKPHWHIVLLFDGKKSFEQVREISDKLNAPIPQKVASMRYLVRYLAHLDHPDKKQYSPADIVSHGGAEVHQHLQPPASERYELIGEMMDFVRDSEITEISELHDYARVKRFDDWFPLLCDNSGYIMEQYIKSRRHAFYADKEERRKNTNAKELKNIATPPI